MMRLADEDQAIDATLDELADLLELLVEIIFRAGEEQRVARREQLGLDGLRGAGEIADRERWEDRADGVRPACGQRAGRAVRHPAKLLDRAGDALAGRGETTSGRLMARETVAVETPAMRATCRRPTCALVSPPSKPGSLSNVSSSIDRLAMAFIQAGSGESKFQTIYATVPDVAIRPSSASVRSDAAPDKTPSIASRLTASIIRIQAA